MQNHFYSLRKKNKAEQQKITTLKSNNKTYGRMEGAFTFCFTTIFYIFPPVRTIGTTLM